MSLYVSLGHRGSCPWPEVSRREPLVCTESRKTRPESCLRGQAEVHIPTGRTGGPFPSAPARLSSLIAPRSGRGPWALLPLIPSPWPAGCLVPRVSSYPLPDLCCYCSVHKTSPVQVSPSPQYKLVLGMSCSVNSCRMNE